MKTISKWMTFFLMFLSLPVLTGCIKDGDETISLEEGNVKKMIVGRWKIKTIEPSNTEDFVFVRWKPGTGLVFYDDGTYTDDSDGGTKRHLWKLPGGDNTRIKLDDKDFDYDLKPGLWVLRFPPDDNSRPRWIIRLEKDDTDDEPEYEYRVSKIVKNSWNIDRKPTYTFSYDSQGRISKYTMPQATYTYRYDNGYVFLCDESGQILKSCTLNSKGYITNEETTSAAKQFYSSRIEYKNDYLSVIHANHGTYAYDYSVSNPGELSFTVTAGHEAAFYHIGGDKNDSNIDLNPFVSLLWESEPSYLTQPLIPFDFYGKRYNIIGSEQLHTADYYYDSYQVERNSDGLISKISYSVMAWHGYDYYKLRDDYIEVTYEKVKK